MKRRATHDDSSSEEEEEEEDEEDLSLELTGIRLTAYNVYRNRAFDHFILACIGVNCICMALDDPVTTQPRQTPDIPGRSCVFSALFSTHKGRNER